MISLLRYDCNSACDLRHYYAYNLHIGAFQYPFLQGMSLTDGFPHSRGIYFYLYCSASIQESLAYVHAFDKHSTGLTENDRAYVLAPCQYKYD